MIRRPKPMGQVTAIQVRKYGKTGPAVLVLHGGPGAPGYMAPVARRLAATAPFRALEPLQRGSSPEQPLTVARHIADLHEVLQCYCGDERPTLVGHSWGAMLALAYAAEHVDRVKSLALVGCGTFDPVARHQIETTRAQRMSPEVRRRMERLAVDYPDPDKRLAMMAHLLLPVDSHELLSTGREVLTCDAQAQQETWDDMIRLQDAGVYPAAFGAIDVPVLMLHGAEDPHPGSMIRESLEPCLPQLKYRELPQCGHYPWLEKAARDEFFDVLREWLGQHPAA